MHNSFYKVILSATGLTILLQLLGLFRQSLTISYYGLSRDLDLFWTIYAMAAVSVFSIGIIVEIVHTALLVQLRDEQGNQALQEALLPYAASSVVLGCCAGLLFITIVPALELIYCAGFSNEDRAVVDSLIYPFLPWIVGLIAYYGLSAAVKTIWAFNWAFVGELLIMLVSITLILFQHDSIQMLPLAYGAGYWLATIWLWIRLLKEAKGRFSYAWVALPVLMRRIVKHYSALMTSTLYGFAERFWMSSIPEGGIASIQTVQQLTMGLSSLLNMRDAYLVPLAQEQGREERLRRLLMGVLLISISACSFIAWVAPEITSVLFNYGRTSNKDLVLIASLLSLGAITTIPATLSALVWRTRQLSGHHNRFMISSITNASLTFGLGWILIKDMQLGANGIVVMQTINSCISLLIALSGLKDHSDFVKNIFKWAGLIGGVSTLFSFMAVSLARNTFHQPILVILLSGIAYSVLTAAFGYLLRHKLRALCF